MRTKPSKVDLIYDTVYTDGIITYKNENTTLGFVRFNDDGEIEYIFVQPFYRRKGLAFKLLKEVQCRVKNKLTFQEPISPTGSLLISSFYDRMK
jgi:GNAT superfamily N-acetyltransferase